jgi:ubiquinone/menaquinone biosynthesis C-methylase UbiE
MQTTEHIKDIVKEKYGNIAKQAASGCCAPSASSCCGDAVTLSSSSCCGDSTPFSEDYSQLEGHYAEADLNLGCGVPTKFAQIAEGDVVLDLGSGAGNDVFVARSLVGEQGKVIGVDMTEEMVARAKRNQAKVGYQNVEFRLGEIENLPVNPTEIDVILSNCVLNLVPDKREAFREIFRVLKPGGHFSISDIVLQGELPERLKSMAEMYVGCVAGAMQYDEYLRVIQETGFVEVEVKKERKIELSDEMLTRALSDKELDEVRKLRSDGNGVLSITVFGKKPVV